MASRSPIPTPRCMKPKCNKIATTRVHNMYEAFCGDFCLKHAEEKEKELTKHEKGKKK